MHLYEGEKYQYLIINRKEEKKEKDNLQSSQNGLKQHYAVPWLSLQGWKC